MYSLRHSQGFDWVLALGKHFRREKVQPRLRKFMKVGGKWLGEKPWLSSLARHHADLMKGLDVFVPLLSTFLNDMTNGVAPLP